MDANSIESIENEYINEDTSDPHVMKPLIKFGDILEEQGIDPYMATNDSWFFWRISSCI